MQPVWPCAAVACVHREPFVHRPALVGLEMAERDPAQALGRDDAAKRVAVERKHLAQTGVEHQRLVAEDEKLVEGEAGGRGDVRHVGREPVDAVADLADCRFHEFLHVIKRLRDPSRPAGRWTFAIYSLYICV
jgi:hypothetical protein